MPASGSDDAHEGDDLPSLPPISNHKRRTSSKPSINSVAAAHNRSASIDIDSPRHPAFQHRHRRSASAAALALLPSPREHEATFSSPNTPGAQMVDIQLDPPSKGGIMAFYERNKGLAYVLLAQIFGVLMNVTTRLLEIEGNKGAGMHPFQILFVRMIITTTLSVGYMWWTKTPHFPFGLPEVRWLLILRGIGGFFGVFGMYYSLMYLPLADATVVTFISPIISCWACSILINEPFTRMEQVGAFISFFGVTLIARPTTFFQHPASHSVPPADGTPDGQMSGQESMVARAVADYNNVTSAQRLGAVLVALVGVLGQAGAFTAMRWMGKRAHPLLSVTYFCACCTIVSGVAMVVLPNVSFVLPQDLKEWTYLVFLGICGFAMQFLLAAGLQHEKSSRATNMVYTQMLFAIIFDKLIFGTNPSLLSLMGSGLILGSAIYIAIQKESMKQQQEKAAKEQQPQSATSDVEMTVSRSRSGRHSRTTSLALREEQAGLVQGMDAEDDDEAGQTRRV